MENLVLLQGWELGRKHNPGQGLEICAPLLLTCCVALCHWRRPPCLCLLSSSVIILSLDINVSLGMEAIFCSACLSTNVISLWIIICTTKLSMEGPTSLQSSSPNSQQDSLVRDLSTLEQFFLKDNISLNCIQKIIFYICSFLLSEVLKVWLCEFCSLSPGLCGCVLLLSTHQQRAQAQGQAVFFSSPREDQSCDTSVLPLFLTGIFIAKPCSLRAGI